MKKNNLLLEIGTEELPARFIFPALKSLKEETERLLKTLGLSYEEVLTGGTFRRLSLFVKNLDAKQEDREEEILGPSLRAGLDEKGNFTKAALGFARKHGVAPQELKIKETKKGKYFCVVKKIKGEETESLLEKHLPELIRRIYFPKRMRWGNYDFTFGRPIRWIVCLFGKKIIPFEIAGVKSGNFSYGHRFLSKEKILIEDADWESYENKLRDEFVILLPEERIDYTRKTIQEVVSPFGEVDLDEELLIENANLVEFPFPVVGTFPEKFLELPSSLIKTVLKEHQRYFCVLRNGELVNHFVAVNNNRAKNMKIITKGHEKVTKARLEDAKFYYERDLKRELEEFLEELKSMVYHIKIGTLWDKTERLIKLGEFLNEKLELCPEREVLKEALRFAKVDLPSELVGEFPSLQGEMARIYLLKKGKKEIAEAVYEQYLPLPDKEERLPQTPEGIILALSDRIDHLASLFGAGEKPSGERDPYGLRRAAFGIIKILINKRLFLNLKEVFLKALSLLRDQGFISDLEVLSDLFQFFGKRLEGEFLSLGFSKEMIRCVMAAENLDPYDVFLKLKSLQSFQKAQDFEEFFTGFKRAVQILKNQKLPEKEVNPSLFEKEEETKLFKKVLELEGKINKYLQEKDYSKFLETLSEIKPFVDDFFDKVFVMVEDEDLRNNRLLLLKKVVSLFEKFGDLTHLI